MSTSYRPVSSNGLTLASSATLSWNSDVNLVRDAANILALKNGATAQTFRIYGNTTGSKYISLSHDGTNGILSVSSGVINVTSSMNVAAAFSVGSTAQQGIIDIFADSGTVPYIRFNSILAGEKTWRLGTVAGNGSFNIYNQTDNVFALSVANAGAVTCISTLSATGFLVGATAGIDAAITAANFGVKTITVTKGIITGFA